MPFANINGIEMHYHEEGEGNPVVLINGFSGDTSFFKQMIPELSSKYRVITFDNRGAGLTRYPGNGIRKQDFVDDVLALMDHLHVFKAHMLGWSMGAHIAQEFALQHPERLKSLTLVSAYPYRPARSSYFMNGIVDCALKGADPEYISMMTNAFCFETVCNISVPTLSIHGLSDIMVEPKLGDYISDRIPGCKVMRIPDVGHIIRTDLYSREFMEHIRANDC